jgi:hypothetical protein
MGVTLLVLISRCRGIIIAFCVTHIYVVYFFVSWTCKQIDVLMLDLDVGFIDSPLKIVQKLDHSKSDIFVQVHGMAV